MQSAYRIYCFSLDIGVAAWDRTQDETFSGRDIFWTRHLLDETDIASAHISLTFKSLVLYRCAILRNNEQATTCAIVS